jgi:thioredoxin 1
MIAPILDELVGEYKDRMTVGKVNVDENRQVATRFGIRSIPTLLLLRDGARADQIVGLQSKAAIKAKVDQFLSAK